MDNAYNRRFPRRSFLSGTLAGAAIAPLCTLPLCAEVPHRSSLRHDRSSPALAYAFLDDMMDLYTIGATLRMAQSFVPTRALRSGDVSYTYDDALVAI